MHQLGLGGVLHKKAIDLLGQEKREQVSITVITTNARNRSAKCGYHPQHKRLYLNKQNMIKHLLCRYPAVDAIRRK